jgi:hypothetical protein
VKSQITKILKENQNHSTDMPIPEAAKVPQYFICQQIWQIKMPDILNFSSLLTSALLIVSPQKSISKAWMMTQ